MRKGKTAGRSITEQNLLTSHALCAKVTKHRGRRDLYLNLAELTSVEFLLIYISITKTRIQAPFLDLCGSVKLLETRGF